MSLCEVEGGRASEIGGNVLTPDVVGCGLSHVQETAGSW